MRIDELNIPKEIISTAKSAVSSKDEFSDWGNVTLDKEMRKLGWIKPKIGSSSTVYSNPNKNYVLKVNYHPDKAYQHYVNLIKKYPNKHFPRISDVKKFKIGKREYYVYLIEKLQPINSRFLSNLFEKYFSYDFGQEDGENFDNKEKKFIKDNPEMLKALEILDKNSKRFGADSNPSNFMKRSDGTVVLIDPYAEEGML
jgi:hypothetical protein